MSTTLTQYTLTFDSKGKPSVTVVGTKDMLLNPGIKRDIQEILAAYRSDYTDKPKVYLNEGDACTTCNSNLIVKLSQSSKPFLACSNNGCNFTCFLARKSNGSFPTQSSGQTSDRQAVRYMNANDPCSDCSDGVMIPKISKLGKPYLNCSNSPNCQGFAYPHKAEYLNRTTGENAVAPIPAPQQARQAQATQAVSGQRR